MKINDILAKMLRKEELTEAERKFLETYREPKPDTSKLTELQQQLNQLQTEKDELQSRLDEKDDKDKTETERLQGELTRMKTKLAAAEKERDTVRAEKESLEFDNSVGALAAEHRFGDREYLKYLVGARKLDVKDKEAARAFMENLKKDSPKYFEAEVNRGGGGTGGDGGDGHGNNAGKEGKGRIEELLKKPELSLAEAAEVAKLQAEIDSNGDKDN